MENLNSLFEKCDSLFDESSAINHKLEKACINYLNKVLDKVIDNRVEIDEDLPVCCEYDGGNHPEYDSNCFSNVYAVYKKNGEIYLEIEDATDYSIDNINADTLYYICESVKCSIEKNYDIE